MRPHPPVALSAAQAERYRRAFADLRSGRLEQALAAAIQLVREAGDAADAHQLLAMCRAEAGLDGAADEAFRHARSLAPGNAMLGVNHAAWLRRRGRAVESLAVLDRCAESAQTRLHEGLAALDVPEPARAEAAFQRAVVLDPLQVLAWHGLGSARQALGKLEDAEEAFLRVVGLSPDHVPGWVNLGNVQRLLGRPADALASFRTARRLGHVDVDFDDMVNGTLLDDGQVEVALVQATDLVRRHPHSAQAHDTLARIRWEHAAEDDPFQEFGQAVMSQPSNPELALRYIRLLLAAERAADALGEIARVRRAVPAGPVIDWLEADAWGRLGDHTKADACFVRADRALGAVSPAFLNAFARHAFRTGRPGLARTCAERALGLAPDDQEAWSHLGTAWRIAGDAREDWLFGYERLVGDIDIEPPAEHAGNMATFLQALATVLETMHAARRAPLEQSVRQGSQTSGRLFGHPDGVVAAAACALQDAAERWLRTLPDDPRHPFLARRRSHVRTVGSWSVKLWSAGHHANHIHQEGWLSSAFYVALPPVMDAMPEMRQGWLQLGQPMSELGLDLAPRRLLRPRAGRLALFPSYMWHGTVPFHDDQPRMTIAFDMQPASNRLTGRSGRRQVADQAGGLQA